MTRAAEVFLKWVSASYREIREAASGLKVPNELYEKYRLSPFLVKPLVRPDHPPPTAPADLHLAPVPGYLARRVTDGVYHALAAANQRSGKANAFRQAFGFAFQDYVGQLLLAGAPSGSVRAEWSYESHGQRRQTPDWLVLHEDRLLVIEVKQSVVGLYAKMSGHMNELAENLERTLTKGVRQLLTFRDDLLARVHDLQRLSGSVRDIELLLVTHDEVPFGNWLMRDVIAQRVPGADHVQICSIDEFEDLQRYCWGNTPFELLAAKRVGSGNSSQFGLSQWLRAQITSDPPRHVLLDSTFERVMASYGVAAGSAVEASAEP